MEREVRPRTRKISILSPVYNEELHIAEMICSVQRQDHADWELLLVDDGSTDGTAQLIKDAAQRDPRVRLLSEGKKLRKVAAFNLAFAHASGDIIVLLAGDDRLPEGSLSIRAQAVAQHCRDSRAVAFFKLRTFSTSTKFDGMVLPRGESSSRSGGSITMTRGLAEVVFPIDESLVAEDIWLGKAAPALADHVIEKPDIVLDYRIHEGNSNPRSRPFAEMNEAMHLRLRAYDALLQNPRFNLPNSARQELEHLWSAEIARHQSRLGELLRMRGVPLVDRLALASSAHPLLYAVRTRFYRLFSGLRGA